MKLNKIIFFLFVIFASICADAQVKNRNVGKKKKSIVYNKNKKAEKPNWVFGIGWNVVDDNSYPFKKLFDIRKSWLIRPYPTQLIADRSYKNGFSLGGVFNFNMYKPSKLINGTIGGGSGLFFSLDFLAKYHLKEIINLPKWADPYLPFGTGYTLRFSPPHRNTFMLNMGVGANFWVYQEWIGINVQSLAKFGLKSPFLKTGSNYLQHSIGIVIKLFLDKKKKWPFIKPKYEWIHREKGGGERLN